MHPEFAMCQAAKEGYLDTVKQLIEGGVSVNCRDSDDYRERTPLHWAAYLDQYEVVDFLSSLPECDLTIKDKIGRTPVLYAACMGFKRVVDLLLERGAEMNCASHTKFTLLHMASRHGWTDIVLCILDSGEADINAEDGSGFTPLITSAYYGCEEVATLLICAGADAHRTCRKKRTALHWAAFCGHTKIIQLLLEKEGLDLNSQDENGDTPLHIVCQETCCPAMISRYREVVKQLLVDGADTTIKNNKGNKVLSECIRTCRIEEIRLLVQHGVYIEYCDYALISQNPFLKEHVLKDVHFCTQSIVNKFHNQSLPSLKGNPNFGGKLPSIDKFRLNAQHIHDVENFVKCDIQANTFCNIIKARPIVLRIMCVESLIAYRSGMKRSASSDFGKSNSPFKKPHNE